MLLGGSGPMALGEWWATRGSKPHPSRAMRHAGSVRLSALMAREYFFISCSKSLEVPNGAPEAGVGVVGSRLSPNRPAPSLKLTRGAAPPDQALAGGSAPSRLVSLHLDLHGIQLSF